MAFRFLIYSTGTTYADTIVRESATDNPGAFEASLNSDFVIPEIQPLYLWRVTGDTTVVPNIDANINAYLEAVAPPPEPEDDATVGFVTGITTTKIDKVTGITGNLGEFNAEGNLIDTGYAVSDLTGGTQYNFTGSGGTEVFTGSTTGVVEIIIRSTEPTGTTVAWGDITGTLSAQTDLQDALNLKLDITDFNSYTGATQPVIDAALTGVTNLGTGSTIAAYTLGRDAYFKSISVLGGLTISGDANNLIISGQTGGTGGSTDWGDIGGTLSNQTDLWNELTGITATSATKLDINTFTGYTASTDNRLDGIEGDITYLSGQTDLRLTISDFNSYTGATQPVIDSALTGATNGLTATGRDVELGGALTKNTLIGVGTFALSANTASIHLQAVNGINIIDTDGVGGVNIESDAGTVAIIGNTNLGVETTKLEISESSMLITDSRGTQVGLQYAGDYSTDFTNESLITKRYADTIAGGLIPKAAVLVASTGETVLSGLTTIDGVSLSNGDRVLVKNNADASQNGIYVASASTWSRSEDFDGNPAGEVSAGDMIPVLSGVTNNHTIWVLVTPNPITVGVTDLEFTLFSEPHELTPGHGISIDGNLITVDGGALDGNSIAWTGTTGNETFNVDINSGTLATALGSKLDVTVFNTFTGTTLPANYLSITDFNSFTGTTLPANYYNKTEINSYTATTDTRLDDIESDITFISGVTDTKLDESIFTGYTATTAPNEIFLIHTGGTDLNTILATAIEWDAVGVTGATGAAFSWTGGSEITILDGGDYEINYNIPYNIGSNSSIGIGANVILNNSTVIDVTAAAAVATRTSGAASVGLPTVIVSLSLNDVLTLATFRTHQSGAATSSLTGSVLIKKKNTLQ